MAQLLRKRFQREAAKAAPRGVHDPPRRVLLATAAMQIEQTVIDEAIALATPEHAKITVLGVARVYGTSLGLPNPGLQPTSREIQDLKGIVARTAEILRGRGFEVREALSKSRNAPKMIARWGVAKSFHAIVVPDPERPRWRKLIEGDITQEIERRCGIPVKAVPVSPPSYGRTRAS